MDGIIDCHLSVRPVGVGFLPRTEDIFLEADGLHDLLYQLHSWYCAAVKAEYSRIRGLGESLFPFLLTQDPKHFTNQSSVWFILTAFWQVWQSKSIAP
jgi:hypothetical protein